MSKNILLFGNPNVGKTTVFNKLTGSHERISNFDGSTVLKKTAAILDTDYDLIDTPGSYGLNGNSISDVTTLNTLFNEDFNQLIDVIDINSLKKNCYLLIDLLETKKAVTVLLNKTDIFSGSINLEHFSAVTSTNTILINRDGEINVNQIINTCPNNFHLNYHPEIEQTISELLPFIQPTNNIDARFIAVQFLKANAVVDQFITDLPQANILKNNLEQSVVNNGYANSLIGLIFKNRQNWIHQLLTGCYTPQTKNNSLPWMNKYFDRIALHPVWGFVLFTLIMYTVFFISFSTGFLSDYFEVGLTFIFDNILNVIKSVTSNQIVISFFEDGMFAGVTGILVFLPQLIMLFFLLTLLEGVGYLPRVSALFENLFNKLGISAHSLIPYISGLGCNVLGILTTRTIKNENKRIAAILSAPFISCSARLPVYVIFIEIFFPRNQALVLLFLYFLGIFVAVAYSFVVSKIVYKSHEEINIINLPVYNKVDTKHIYKMVKLKIKSFLSNAGKLILIGSIIVWFFSFFGFNGYTQDISTSFLTAISGNILPIFAPLGFDTVQATSSLLSAFLAKELAISSMVVMYGVNNISGLSGVLTSSFSVASALSFMVFYLLYIPCLSTLGAIYAETKSTKIIAISIVSSLTIGYALSFITYNIASFLF